MSTNAIHAASKTADSSTQGVGDDLATTTSLIYVANPKRTRLS